MSGDNHKGLPAQIFVESSPMEKTIIRFLFYKDDSVCGVQKEWCRLVRGKAWWAPVGMRQSWLWLVRHGFGHGLGAVVVGHSWIQDSIINLVIACPHCGVNNRSGNIHMPGLCEGAFFQFELLSGILEIRLMS